MPKIIEFKVEQYPNRTKIYAVFGGKEPALIARVIIGGDDLFYAEKAFDGCPQKGADYNEFCSRVCHAYAQKKGAILKKITWL